MRLNFQLCCLPFMQALVEPRLSYPHALNAKLALNLFIVCSCAGAGGAVTELP